MPEEPAWRLGIRVRRQRTMLVLEVHDQRPAVLDQVGADEREVMHVRIHTAVIYAVVRGYRGMKSCHRSVTMTTNRSDPTTAKKAPTPAAVGPKLSELLVRRSRRRNTDQVVPLNATSQKRR